MTVIVAAVLRSRLGHHTPHTLTRASGLRRSARMVQLQFRRRVYQRRQGRFASTCWCGNMNEIMNVQELVISDAEQGVTDARALAKTFSQALRQRAARLWQQGNALASPTPVPAAVIAAGGFISPGCDRFSKKEYRRQNLNYHLISALCPHP